MKKRLLFLVVLFVALIVLFAIQKPAFMLYNIVLCKGCTLHDWLAVISNGLTLDISMSGYIMILPALMVLISIWIKGSFWRKILKTYFVIIALAVSIAFVADMALYPYWGYKLNSSIWFYLASPKDAAASLELWPTIGQIVIIIIYAALFYCITALRILPLFNCEESVSHRFLSSLTMIVFLGFLLLPIRGGIYASVANEGRAYFSSNMFLNHSAVNPCFSLMVSSARQQSFSEQYSYMSEEEAEKLKASLFETSADGNKQKVLENNRPNIVMVILEGFAGTTVGAVGGDESITPNLNALAQEGITFNDIYANSFRTDRGLVSIINAFPAQPTSSIMKYPAKCQTLPGIAQHLKQAGYSTSVYYGGDIDFTNMRSFFYSSGYDTVIGQDALSFEEPMAQWGYDDRLMANYFADKVLEQAEKQQPFFMTLLTLSSHEPFDVPFSKFNNQYANSVAFTDDCLGDLFEKLRSSDVWDNTLIILLPDHSSIYPEGIPRRSPEQHHIFIVWGGGTIKEPAVIDKTGNQCDLAATLLGQLDLPAEQFKYSKDLLDSGSPDFAFYTFDNGFGLVKKTTDGKHNSVVWDCTAQQPMMQSGEDADKIIEQGKAYLQLLMKDFDNR